MKRIVISESQFRRLIKEEESNGDAIEPTIGWAKAKYDEFNQKYFNNFLPKCGISIRPLGEKGGYVLCGTFHFTRTDGAIGLDLFYDDKTDSWCDLNKDTVYKCLKPVISLNSKYAAPEKLLENILIHEMCHYRNYFNEDGTLRQPSRDDNGHGSDFLEIAKMVAENSGGEVQINSVLQAEQVKALRASSYFSKDGYKVCVVKYQGQDIFWYTKYPGIWIKYAFSVPDDNIINVTEDAQVLMLIKRYRYSPTTYTNKNFKAYGINQAPETLQDAFEKASYTKVTKETYSELFPDE